MVGVVDHGHGVVPFASGCVGMRRPARDAPAIANRPDGRGLVRCLNDDRAAGVVRTLFGGRRGAETSTVTDALVQKPTRRGPMSGNRHERVPKIDSSTNMHPQWTELVAAKSGELVRPGPG